MDNQMATSAQGRPVVYVAVGDNAYRAAIVEALRHQGATVIEYRTGFHLLGALADLIEGARPARQPRLLVVDAVSRGCSGITIAAGLRDLEVQIPVVIVARPGDPVVESDGQLIRVVSASHAASSIAEIARPLAPLGGVART
jgi:FixJ family two-component response regulator